MEIGDKIEHDGKTYIMVRDEKKDSCKGCELDPKDECVLCPLGICNDCIKEGSMLKLIWEPKNGEMIEVSNQEDFEYTTIKPFIGMCGGLYVTGKITDNGYTSTFTRKYARQIPTTYTITIDGKTAEISAESIEALKKLIDEIDTSA